jgi:uncharacterized protein YegP (UPF0339 family)
MKTIGFRNLSLLTIAIALAAAPVAGCAVEEDVASSDTIGTEAVVRPTFELYKDGGSFRFDFLAANYEQLLGSQAYSTRTMALNGLLSVLDNGGFAARYQVVTNTDGSAYFVLRAINAAIIGTSDTYVSRAGAEAGVAATVDAVGAYLAHWSTATGKRFEVFEGANGKWYFNLHAGNGEIVLSSQGYSSEAAALNGCFSVVDYGVTEARYLVNKASNGGYYLNLTAANGQIIATSEVYNSKYNAERARDAIIVLLPNVELLCIWR